MEGKSLKEIIRSEYTKCAADPVYFMRKYCYIQHPKKGKILFHLYPFQEKSLVDLKTHDYNIILKSRQLGISTLTAGYALWLMTFHQDKNILVIATTQEVAKNLVTKVRVMYENLPSWLKPIAIEDNKLSLRFKNGSQIKAVSSASTSGRSEALSLLIIDEAAFIDRIEEIWGSAQQTLATGGQAIILSTPNGTGNFFHKTWAGAEERSNPFNTIKLHWTVHPERNESWRKRQDELLGPRMAAQECDCDFVSSGATVVEGAILKWYEETYIKDPESRRGFDGNLWIWNYPDYNKTYVVVADVARGDSSDHSAFHVLDVTTMEQVAEYKGQLSTKDYGNMLVGIATEYNDAMLVIENANIGWATIQQVIDRGYKNLYYSSRETGFAEVNQQLARQTDLRDQSQLVPGFTTSSRTRPLIISKLEEYMREQLPIIRSKRLIQELYTFIWKGSRAESQDGYNDDLVMSFGIALWIRDTAIRLKQEGMDLNRKALDYMVKYSGNQGTGVYNSRNIGGTNPWQMRTGDGNEDITWLIK